MSESEEYPSVIQTLRQTSGPVRVLLIGTLINRLGTFLQVYLVLFLTRRGFSAADAGVALGAYGVGSVCGVLLGGSISGRLGYRWTIAGSMAAAGALTAGLVHLSSLAAVIAAVTAIGIATQASRPCTMALLVDVTPRKQHVMVFAVYRLAFNLGTVAGPLMGAVLIAYSYDLMFYVDAITSAGFALLALTLPHSVGAPESSPPESSPEPAALGRSGRSYWAMLRDLRYVLFLLALFLMTIVHIQSMVVLPLKVTASGHSPTFYGALLSLNALVVTVLELPYTKFVQRVPQRLAVAVGIGLLGAGMMVYLAGTALAIFVVATLVWTVGEMTVSPTAAAYPGSAGPPALRARYIAGSVFAMQIGMAAGPALGTAAWALWRNGVWWLCGLLSVLAVLAAVAGMAGKRVTSPSAGDEQAMPSAADADVA